MKIQLTPGFILTSDDSGFRVTKRATGETFGPDDIVQFYPSWPLQPCRQSVRRAAALAERTLAENDVISQFCGPGRPTTDRAMGQIQLRVSLERKLKYVRAAKSAGKNLSEWIIETCDDQAI
jgi:hypothetical protein